MACVFWGLMPAALPDLSAAEPIRFGFLWHMHQPIYYPYEPLTVTDANNRFSFSVVDVHNQRFGPYTTWPRDAVQAGVGLAHLGASMSVSGSLIENLNVLAGGGGMWTGWTTGHNQGAGLATTLGNPRLDLVAFGYHHPLMPLLDDQDIRMQIRLHRHLYEQTWNVPYPRGMFPPETAFSTRMIPALVAEGIDWVLADNIHFDRACVGYPHTNASCLFAPNRADQLNPNPADAGGAWVQLDNLWAPSQVSAPFGYQPHHAQHVDPQTGAVTKMVVVPAARYEGNEDGRGGYGAFLYDQVMDQYLAQNTDAAHPMFVMLHHDGDNFGGGSEAYYHGNFQNMVSWVSGDPDYECTTAQDYLDRFPPEIDDVIHVEDGSWAGADCGDPEFKKWLGDPDASNWSPDRNSWAVLTAAKNRVFFAEAAAPHASLQNILTGAGSSTERAWHFLLSAEASDHWYWDGSSEPWDSNVTRGCNQAVVHADAAIVGEMDPVPPTVFLPQREPYNPGGFEWNSTPEPSDFEVWTYVYDVSGVVSVALKWRVDADGENPLASIHNETYVGGPEVGAWISIAMTVTPEGPRPANVLAPTYRADRYAATIADQNDVLIDYYVEAVDGQGNVETSPIQHVYVGATVPGGGDVVGLMPDPPQAGQPVLIQYDPAGRPLADATALFLHYGFDNWNPVISPDPPMQWNAAGEVWEVSVSVPAGAVQLDLVFNDGAGLWDNNGGQDWHVAVESAVPQDGWVLDGVLDADATLVALNGGMTLHAGVRGAALYVAVPDAGEGQDHFVFVADHPGPWQAAPWAKAGQAAGWSAFLADENDNDFEAWFDLGGGVAVQAATGANGGVLEGTIDLAEQLGSVPDEVWLSFAAFATADGGGLVAPIQVPSGGNGDGNVDAAEYVRFETFLRGDVTGDWRVDLADAPGFVDVLLDIDSEAAHERAADMNDADGANAADLPSFIEALLGS